MTEQERQGRGLVAQIRHFARIGLGVCRMWISMRGGEGAGKNASMSVHFSVALHTYIHV